MTSDTTNFAPPAALYWYSLGGILLNSTLRHFYHSANASRPTGITNSNAASTVLYSGSQTRSWRIHVCTSTFYISYNERLSWTSWMECLSVQCQDGQQGTVPVDFLPTHNTRLVAGCLCWSLWWCRPTFCNLNSGICSTVWLRPIHYINLDWHYVAFLCWCAV